MSGAETISACSRRWAQRAVAGVPSSAATSAKAPATDAAAASPMTWKPAWMPATVQAAMCRPMVS